MIIEFIMDMILGAVTGIINILMSMFPAIDLGSYMAQFTIELLKITTQANNMLHFILGDFVDVLVPFTIALLVYKYIAYPILVVIRSIFVNGNN